MIGHVEGGHLAQVERDGFRDAALLGLDARIGRRRVDERDHGAPELLGQLHRPQRLAVTLRLGVPEVPEDLLLRVAAAAFVMADDHDRLRLVAGEAGDHGVVVGKPAIAADLGEVGEQPVDVVEHRGPVRVPRHQHPLPGRQIARRCRVRIESMRRRRLSMDAEPLGRLRQHRQRLDLLEQHRDRLFELECIGRHPSRYPILMPSRDRAGHDASTADPDPAEQAVGRLCIHAIWITVVTAGHRTGAADLSTSDTSCSDGRTRICALTSMVTRSRRLCACSSTSNATRRSPLCCAKTSQSRSKVPRSCGGVDSRMATDVASRSRTSSIGAISAADNAGRLVVALELPLTSTTWPFSAQMSVLLERLREHHDLDAAVRILEHEHAHAVALPRLQRTEAGRRCRRSRSPDDARRRVAAESAATTPRVRRLSSVPRDRVPFGCSDRPSSGAVASEVVA